MNLVVGGMIIIFFILLFLMFRAIVLWYWKIDKIVELLNKIEGHLGGQVKDLK